MIYDFHTHTFLSDGENSPIELVRFAVAFGYCFIALTDHGSYSNLDFIISRLKKDCELAEKYVDLLAHPGILKLEEARLAAKNGIFLEISSRARHSLTNGVVVNIGREAGVKFLINSDAHSHHDLFRSGMQERVGLGAGLTKDEIEEICSKNQKEFLKRIK